MRLLKWVVFPLRFWLHSKRKFFGCRIINPPHKVKVYVRHRKSTPRSDREVYDVLAALLKMVTHFLQICRRGNHQPAATANLWIARQDPGQTRPPLDPCGSQGTPSLSGGGVRKTKLAAGPLRPLYPVARHPKKRSPVLGSQFQRLVDDSVRHGDAQGCSAGLDLVFAPLKQNLVVPLDALLLLLFWCDKPSKRSAG